MEKFHKGHWSCRAKIQPTSEEMKSHFTFYHILLLQPKLGNKPTIPADDLRHAPVVAMLNHLV
jgi:hypothetical protein